MQLKLFLLCSVWSFGLVDVRACSCNIEEFESATRSADEIFLGRVVKAELYNNGTYMDSDDNEQTNYGVKFQFQVSKKWKGSTSSDVVIYMGGTSCDFGFGFQEDGFLVYASKQLGKSIEGLSSGPSDGKNRLTAWMCSRTISGAPYEEGSWYGSDIARLDQEFPDHLELERSRSLWIYWLLGIVLMIIVIVSRKRLP